MREAAYRLYRRRDDRLAAARVATWLSWDYLAFRGEAAVANGWIGRAHRLLDDLPDSDEHGWLSLREGSMRLSLAHDAAGARTLGAAAARIGRARGQIDLEMAGLALEGLALASAGRVADGMRRLDEATAAATGGEMADRNLIALSCCWLILACERVRDYERAAQWCDRLKEFCARWRMRPLFAVCRAQYATVLIARGAWAEAEAELAMAISELEATRPAQVAEGIVRLGELRRRQGRLDEAASLFDRVEDQPLAELGRAAIALDRGDGEGALDLLDRCLRRVPDDNVAERAGALELRVRALAALGRAAEAAAAAEELRAVADAIGTDPLRAAAHAAEGAVAAAEGDWPRARRAFEDALDLHRRAGAPYEAACARLDLATALDALGRRQDAGRQAAAAHEALARLGAAPPPGRDTRSATSGPSGLTAREREVLRLVAQGLTNGEIAARLVLSEHTVHRHVANILTKLDLPSRAAAAVQAARSGLL